MAAIYCSFNVLQGASTSANELLSMDARKKINI